MKKLFFAFCIFLLSCQGPWDYYPEDTPVFKGIWTDAYIISNKPVKDICFDKLHSLDEVRMPGFAFYESAQVEIKGYFSGEGYGEHETTLELSPRDDNPNCFDHYLYPKAGKNYELNATFTWDSSGQMVTSNYTAKTYIPKNFKIKRAYDVFENSFEQLDTILYIPPVDSANMPTIYFIPEYSDDIGGAFVSMILPDTNSIYWGENHWDYLRNQFNIKQDEEELMADHARFGDREIVRVATAQQYSTMKKEIDSIMIIEVNLPAKGSIKLLFYGTTPEYMKYRSSFLQGGDSRTKAIYNIENGAGIFAGMVVDTFKVNLTSLPNAKLYPYKEAQEAYCSEDYHLDHLECLGYQDFEDSVIYESMEWCQIMDFPIDSHPACGTAMVKYSKQPNIKSPILDREVKKWCNEHPQDEEC